MKWIRILPVAFIVFLAACSKPVEKQVPAAPAVGSEAPKAADVPAPAGAPGALMPPDNVGLAVVPGIAKAPEVPVLTLPPAPAVATPTPSAAAASAPLPTLSASTEVVKQAVFEDFIEFEQRWAEKQGASPRENSLWFQDVRHKTSFADPINTNHCVYRLAVAGFYDQGTKLQEVMKNQISYFNPISYETSEKGELRQIHFDFSLGQMRGDLGGAHGVNIPGIHRMWIAPGSVVAGSSAPIWFVSHALVPQKVDSGSGRLLFEYDYDAETKIAKLKKGFFAKLQVKCQ